MKPSIQTLGQILYSPSQYVIPVFQRNYRWETPQWDKLWDSLVEIQSPEKRGNHFMGFLVFVPDLAQPGLNTSFHLIDGQQRLTTLSILLVALRNVARNMGQSGLADEIHQYYLVHLPKTGDLHYRLLPKERDHDSYLAVVNGRGHPSGRVAEALAYFEEKITAVGAISPGRLRQIFDTVCQRFEFMFATLETENAYNIFKSLNSTGVPLGPSDLIRNFVFMHIPPGNHDDFDREFWGPLEDRFATADGTLDESRFSRFFRDFLMSTGAYVPPKETFPVFESRYEATGFSPRDLASALTAASHYYEVISSRQPDENELVTKALTALNLLESSTTYPLLLALFQKRADRVIDATKLASAIDMLGGFILRRFVCGESSRGYGQMFVRAPVKGAIDPITSLEAYLVDRGWPDDRRFEVAFVEFPLYQRGYTREVLDTLERARGNKEPADLRGAQVEHIMPQTLTATWRAALGSESERIHTEWLHRLGNLTLSGYNPELWNHPFETKRERYANSNIVLTRELSSIATWTEAEIRERGQRLARAAAQIWIGPNELVIQTGREPDGAEQGPSLAGFRRHFWSQLNGYLIAVHSGLPEIASRPTWNVRLPSGIRHIGVELRFSLRYREAGIDVWFWRGTSFPIWESIRAAPEPYNELLGSKWGFGQTDGRLQGRMFIDRSVADPRNESSWPETNRWFGEKLSRIYEEILPRLREEMNRNTAGT